MWVSPVASLTVRTRTPQIHNKTLFYSYTSKEHLVNHEIPNIVVDTVRKHNLHNLTLKTRKDISYDYGVQHVYNKGKIIFVLD